MASAATCSRLPPRRQGAKPPGTYNPFSTHAPAPPLPRPVQPLRRAFSPSTRTWRSKLVSSSPRSRPSEPSRSMTSVVMSLILGDLGLSRHMHGG